ncbi:GHMP family kinase ATP-binding protein [Catenuloplanes japonicus]|uniref:GHMP family kinase ATP-binding protein n=1 Tax=Catenuloplanes japonicus TaxID=33876 RepID=UPI00068AEB99|nr:hypothetical protein [Catenuloplanes japonicus]
MTNQHLQLALTDRPATRVGNGFAPGSFGELLQGVSPDDGRDFLVTLPLSIGAHATFTPDATLPDVQVAPARKRKSLAVARRALALLGAPPGGALTIDSSLPEGKGLASSSADLVATVRAVADAYDEAFDETTVEGLLRDVEPTDGVMYAETVAFYHREVRLRERLGLLPPLTLVAYDAGGAVDTVTFNRLPHPYSAEDTQEFGRLYRRLATAVREHDLRTVGRVCTRSAELSTRLMPRAELTMMIRLCHEVDGLGVVVTHSGTNIGVLLAPGSAADAVAHVRGACRPLPGSASVYTTLGTPEDGQ